MILDGWEALTEIESTALRMRHSGRNFNEIGKAIGRNNAQDLCRIAQQKLDLKARLNKAMRERRGV